MDVWTAIKKGMIFIILSIFILMLVSLIPTQLLTRTDEVSTQNPSTLLQTDATEQYKTYQNVEVNVSVVDLDESLTLLQTLIDEASVNLVSSFICSTDTPSSNPVARFTIAVSHASMTDFLGKVSSSLQVSEIKTYTDTEMLLVEGIDSWIKNLSIQEKRYQELLSEAYELEEILAIETELSRVRTELDEWQSLKEKRDMVKVTISFYLVKNPATSWQEAISEELVMQLGQMASYSKILVIKLIGCLPYFVVVLFVVILARLIFKRSKRRR